jgi:hypothetical protein
MPQPFLASTWSRLYPDEKLTIGTVVPSLLERYESAPPEVQHQVDRLLAQAEDDRAWAEQLGPVYRQADVAALLGVSKQAASSNPGLLRLEMRDGTVGYPVWQFDGDRLVPGVRQVVLELNDVVASPWTIASWLTSPNEELDGRPPLECLRQGDVTHVATTARRLAQRLAG